MSSKTAHLSKRKSARDMATNSPPKTTGIYNAEAKPCHGHARHAAEPRRPSIAHIAWRRRSSRAATQSKKTTAKRRKLICGGLRNYQTLCDSPLRLLGCAVYLLQPHPSGPEYISHIPFTRSRVDSQALSHRNPPQRKSTALCSLASRCAGYLDNCGDDRIARPSVSSTCSLFRSCSHSSPHRRLSSASARFSVQAAELTQPGEPGLVFT